MALLLDTHALIWWAVGDDRLSNRARRAIETEEVYVSAASAFEISVKHALGKLPQAAALAVDIRGYVESQGFHCLMIEFAHAEKAGALAGPARDPFDRLLVAQSMIEGLSLVSNERPFDAYAIRRLW
ncbi:type II toxin-antitoxin system VapC family toxin [Vineibacter terrae]|uniref:type II toxin-antitoxin system VapC family toxin n=1 Tax=Vineibacter terrae TaxID=2586908 RepID=UPI002E372F08|nr:type II toxin-antitoxin system VapC family toxin [Vineibacter terrae]HEX2890317.1 type II toxin-antitoxin system VapC family toxin [Vineibacter terrae]